MLRHVLVPLDGSALSEQALSHAQDIIAPNGKIILLSVIEMPIDYEYALVDVPLTVLNARAYSDEEYNSTYRRVKDYLNSKARKLAAEGYEVECLVESGEPATVINEIASNNKVNAIVMTTHGRTGLSRWLFGSVTQKVISQMFCPVLVVPGLHPVKSEAAIKAEAANPA